MSKQQNYVCDNCGDILLGKDRMAMVSKEYIHIKGQITAQLKDEDTGTRYFVYITNRADDELSFCKDENKACFDDYVMKKIQLHHNHRRAALMEEASQGYTSDVRLPYVKPSRAYPNTNRPTYSPPASAPKHD